MVFPRADIGTHNGVTGDDGDMPAGERGARRLDEVRLPPAERPAIRGHQHVGAREGPPLRFLLQHVAGGPVEVHRAGETTEDAGEREREHRVRLVAGLARLEEVAQFGQPADVLVEQLELRGTDLHPFLEVLAADLQLLGQRVDAHDDRVQIVVGLRSPPAHPQLAGRRRQGSGETERHPGTLPRRFSRRTRINCRYSDSIEPGSSSCCARGTSSPSGSHGTPVLNPRCSLSSHGYGVRSGSRPNPCPGSRSSAGSRMRSGGTAVSTIPSSSPM